MVEFGVIDTPIINIQIDEWFECVTIIFRGTNGRKMVCNFINCFEILFKHDKTYSKGKNSNGELDYKYFVQDVEVCEKDGFYIFSIDAWPLKGKIVCKKIEMKVC